MYHFSPRIILLILIISGLQLMSTRAADLPDIAGVAKKYIGKIPIPFMGDAMQLWDLLEDMFTVFGGKQTASVEEERQNILLERLGTIDKDIHQFDKNLDEKLDSMVAIDDYKKYRTAYQEAVSEVITKRYHEFLDLVYSGLAKDNDQRKRFALNIVNGDRPMQTLLRNVHREFYGYLSEFESSLLHFLSNQKNQEHYNDFMCEEDKSMQQLVYNYYQKIIECEIKGYVVILYATSVKDAENPEINEQAQGYALSQSFSRIKELVKTMKQFLTVMPRKLWKCNVKNSVEGVHHARIGPIFQKYIMFEKNLLSPSEWDRIDEELRKGDRIGYGSIAEHYSKPGTIWKISEQRNQKPYSCGNVLRDCERQIKAVQICPVDRNITGKPERYQYVKIDGTFKWGEECDTSNVTPWGKIGYKYNVIFGWGSHVCTCIDDNKDLLRYMHVEWVTADRDNVITGIKIVPKNNTLYLQIKQGKLLPNFAVTSVNWKNISYVQSNEYHNLNSSKIVNLSYENKRVFMDDAETIHKNQVLTGVRFAPTASGFRIDAQYSFFNFSNGTLMNNHDLRDSEKDCYSKQQKTGSCYSYSEPDLKNKKMVNLTNLDIPNNPNIYHRNHEISNLNQEYLDLTQTRKDTDFGQNILPFIDIQPVETHPPTPLSGFGLFRRASADSAGYLALKAITFDFSITVKESTEV